MKKDFLLDMLCYILLPLGVCYISEWKSLEYIAILLIVPGILYSLYTFKSQHRLNITAIIFSCIYIIIHLVKKDMDSSFEKYAYDIYILIGILVVIIISNLLKKDIASALYTDILRANGHSKYIIKNNIRKYNLCNEFNRISNIINIHILAIIFIKYYTIINYSNESYKITLTLEMLVNILFLIGEIYITYNIFNHASKKLRNKNTKVLESKKDNIIYLDKCKKANK